MKITVERDVALEAQRWKLDGLAGVVESFRAAELAMTDNIPVTHAPESLAAAAEFAMRVTYHPEAMAHEVDLLLACGEVVAADVVKAQAHEPQAFHNAVTRSGLEEQSAAFKQREAEFNAREEETTAFVRRAIADMPGKALPQGGRSQ